MATQSALRIQNLSQVDFDPATLATIAAIQVNAGFGPSLETPFLVKKVKIRAFMNTVAFGDGPFYLGIAKGDASATEMAQALTENNVDGPEDTTGSLTEDNVWTVWQNTVVMGKPIQETDTKQGHWWDFEVSLGKGIPALEKQGVQLFLFNAGPTMQTGSDISVHYQLWGVWLR